MDIPLQYADDDSQEGSFGAQKEGDQSKIIKNLFQDTKIITKNFNHDEWQECTVNDHNERFWSHADGRRKKTSRWYKQVNQLYFHKQCWNSYSSGLEEEF